MNRPFHDAKAIIVDPLPLEILSKQLTATDPCASVWVAANAGSGKTHLLTRRVLRLILCGAPNAKVLCLTFTKAAASTMLHRINSCLGSWSTMSESDLKHELFCLCGCAPNSNMISRARGLFATTIESSERLRIQTVHAFCESILQRFPLETELCRLGANQRLHNRITGNFEIIDEYTAQQMIEKAHIDTLGKAMLQPDHVLFESIRALITTIGEHGMSKAIRDFIGEREWFHTLINEHGSCDALISKLQQQLSLCDVNEETLAVAILNSPFAQEINIMNLIERLQKTSSDRKQAERFCLAMSNDNEMKERAKSWVSIFCKQNGEPRINAGMTKAIHKDMPMLRAAAELEYMRLRQLVDKTHAWHAFKISSDILRIGSSILDEYSSSKVKIGAFDFQDLIECTFDLLHHSEYAAWIKYKLDQEIDHILIDEAQDLSPMQWNIICHITEDFFCKEPTKYPRTIFVVGDEKQSIYSFQGAQIKEFTLREQWLRELVINSGNVFHNINLEYSFRSASNILQAVDMVFADWPKHKSLRIDTCGSVEIWPTCKEETTKDAIDTDSKIDAKSLYQIQEETNKPIEKSVSTDFNDPLFAMRAAANKVAQEIDAMITEDNINPGDIMILVRRRGPLIAMIAEALSALEVPVSGPDRLLLFEHIAIMDMMALGAIMMRPEDDMSLAAIMRSPLLGFDEEELMLIAISRGTDSIYDTLGAAPEGTKAHGAFCMLESWRQLAINVSVFDFYAIIIGHCSRVRQYYIELFGSEVIDVIDEFLKIARNHSKNPGSNLTSFIATYQDSRITIKRSVDGQVDVVRIMTVHGAKGLEAQVVFIVDSITNPYSAAYDPVFLELHLGSSTPMMLWKPRADAMPDIAAVALDRARAESLDEYRRLLYVAMTRSATKLVIVSYTNKQSIEPADNSWIRMIGQTLEQKSLGIIPTSTRSTMRTANLEKSFYSKNNQQSMPGVNVPEFWSSHDYIPITSLSANSEIIKTSNNRGTIIHHLLAVLPEMPHHSRYQIGHDICIMTMREDYCYKYADSIIQEVLRTIDNPAFAICFARESFAEVPIVGFLDGRSVSVRLDRVVEQGNEIKIFDFKTREAPPDDMPPEYVTQLETYSRLMQSVFTEHKIHTGVIWTAIQRLDWVY